jgi:hypothetical protein
MMKDGDLELVEILDVYILKINNMSSKIIIEDKEFELPQELVDKIKEDWNFKECSILYIKTKELKEEVYIFGEGSYKLKVSTDW